MAHDDPIACGQRQQGRPRSRSSPTPPSSPLIRFAKQYQKDGFRRPGALCPTSGPAFRTLWQPSSIEDALLTRARLASERRLMSNWEYIFEKYSSIPPEEEDEVDLFSGEVLLDRGHLRGMKTAHAFATDLGPDLDTAHELGLAPPKICGPESVLFPPDKDELGDWGEHSGLPEQIVQELPSPVVRVTWTLEDEIDLEAFLEVNAKLYTASGRRPGTKSALRRCPRSLPDIAALRLASKPRLLGARSECSSKGRSDAEGSAGQQDGESDREPESESEDERACRSGSEADSNPESRTEGTSRKQSYRGPEDEPQDETGSWSAKEAAMPLPSRVRFGRGLSLSPKARD